MARVDALLETKEKLSQVGSLPLSKSSFSNSSNYFMVLFYLLLTAMQVRQGTVLIQSKDIGLNASAQNQLNKDMADVKFAMVSPKHIRIKVPTPNGKNSTWINKTIPAGSSTIDEVMAENQIAGALRGDFQNVMITARQRAEVIMTAASANVNMLTQYASQDSNWVSTLGTIFQVIDEMTQ